MNKLLVVGSANIDDTYLIDHIVKPGETLSSMQYEIFPGGKGLNQCIACVRAGADTYFAGKIGADGTFLKDYLEKSAVNIDHLLVGDVPTGRAIIQIDIHGTNSIIVNDGANGTVDAGMVDQVLCQFSADDLLIMQNELTITPYLLDRAHQQGLTIVFNPSPINQRVHDCDLSKVDYLFINETEGLELTKKEQPADILANLLSRYPNLKIVLTMGVEGSWYGDQTTTIHADSVRVEAVDTTGAGDTFTGFFMNSIMTDHTIAQSLTIAAHASALAVSKKGAAISIPTWDEVLAFQASRAE